MDEEKEYDLYERLGGVIFDLPVEEIDREKRNKVKELVWGWAYSIRTPKEQLQERYAKTYKEMERLRKQSVKRVSQKDDETWSDVLED